MARVVFEDRSTGRCFVRGKLLGKGGFASCYEVLEESRGKSFAAKVIAKEALGDIKERKKVQHEIKIHRGLDHPSIARLEAYF
jgi:serine/threonine protein kinase